jgi:hypothetical protein
MNRLFTDETIIGELIRIRIAVARKRHDCHFLRRISSAAPDPVQHNKCPSDALMPPRRYWRRPAQAQRDGRSKDEISLKSLKRVVYGFYHNGNLGSEVWGRRLLAFIEEVKSSYSDADYEFKRPKVCFIHKDGTAGTYRTIASYECLRDRVILGLLARYLRGQLDPLMPDTLHSFRVGASHSHHTAVRELNDYRAAHGNNGLYVAECDIRAFYDTVSHAAVRDAFRETLDRAEKCDITVDSHATRLVDAYLNSYNYQRDVVPAFEVARDALRKGASLNALGPADLRALGYTSVSPQLGIPQGGAVSPQLANLVLNRADRAAAGVGVGMPVFYARFCDDIIIAHPERSAAQSALDAYVHEVAKLRMPIHRPMPVHRYGREYYASKSKRPYLWARPDGRKKVVPWVSFLGYQISFDGKLKVRQSSVQKECQKQIRVVGDVLRVVCAEDAQIHRRGDQILDQIAARMVAMAIGRKDVRYKIPQKAQPCWTDAFFMVDDNVHSRRQMRDLDRGRERQMRRLKRQLGRMGLLTESSSKGKQTPLFRGAPYSYYGALGRAQGAPVRFARKRSGDYGR